MATETITTMQLGKQSRFATLFAEFWPGEDSWSSMTPPVIARVVTPPPHQLSLAAKMSDLLLHQGSPPISPKNSPNILTYSHTLRRHVMSPQTTTSPRIITMPGTFPTSLRSPTPPTTSRGSTTSFQTATSHQVTANDEWTSFSVHDAQILQSRVDAAHYNSKWSYDEANRRPPFPSAEISITPGSDDVAGGAKLQLDVGVDVKEPWSYDRANRAMQEQLQYASSLGLTLQDMSPSHGEQTTPKTTITVTKKRLSPNAKEFVPSSAVYQELKLAMLSAKEFVPQNYEQAGHELEVFVEQQEQCETWEAFQQWQAWVAEQRCYGPHEGGGSGYAETVGVEDSVSCVGGGGDAVTSRARERASSLEEMYVGWWVFPEDGIGEPVWVQQRYAENGEQEQWHEEQEEETVEEEPYEVKLGRWLGMSDDEFCLA